MRTIQLLAIPALVSAATISPSEKHDSVAYLLKNDPSGSSIISLKISNENGSLSSPIETATGGNGLIGMTPAADGIGPPVEKQADALFSQDAVVVSGDYLFTVNAGSNTISMFTIPDDDLQHPILRGSPASTRADFPQSVTYSPLLETGQTLGFVLDLADNITCVLSGGAVAGVTCFHVDRKQGLIPFGGLRPLALNQTTPPVGPSGTASDIVFNPSQTALIATVKNIGTKPGYIYVYPVDKSGSVSQTPIVSRPSEIFMSFSITFINDTHVLIADPIYGAALLTVSPDWKFRYEHRITIENQSATCWSVYNPLANTIFVMDAGVSKITLVDAASGGLEGEIVLDTASLGTFDSALHGEYLFVLRGTSAISVVNTSGLHNEVASEEVPNFNLSVLGPRNYLQGMAVYPSIAVHRAKVDEARINTAHNN